MKKIILCLFILFMPFAAHTYVMCGPYIPDNAEIAYRVARVQKTPQPWAVGTGCAGETTETDKSKMCDNVIVAGDAYPASVDSEINNTAGNVSGIDFLTMSAGYNCMCRRTHINGTENIGQWVVVNGSADVTIQKYCAQYCANAVAYDSVGLRNAIMLLPSML